MSVTPDLSRLRAAVDRARLAKRWLPPAAARARDDFDREFARVIKVTEGRV